jgi:thymidylate kinase
MSVAQPISRVEPALSIAEAFAALTGAGISYALIRAPEDYPSDSIYEYDLLVAPVDLKRLREILRALGFRCTPSFGYEPHHFFLRRVFASWVKLDVVMELRCGVRNKWIAVDTRKWLLRSKRNGCVPVLSPADEFIALLLHCILDKKTFAQRHQQRLRELLTALAEDPVQADLAHEHLRRYLGNELKTVASVARDGSWPVLINLRFPVVFRAVARDPARSAVRFTSGLVARCVRPLALALRWRGIWVALIAPDGAGKTTLAQRIAQDPVLRARSLYLGLNENAVNLRLPRPRFVAHWIPLALPADARFAGRIARVLSVIIHTLDAWYRVAVAAYCKLRGRIVVFDRYPFEEFAAKHRRRIVRTLRYGYWPRPDLTIALDAPGPVLYARKPEHTEEWLERERRRCMAVAQRVPGGCVINAAADEQAVMESTIAVIWDRFAY